VAEVGSLAANAPGGVERLIFGLTAFLRARDIRWAFFTATARLRVFLGHAGIPMTALAPADPARIDTIERWGNYYQQFPKVMLVDETALAGSPANLAGARETRLNPPFWRAGEGCRSNEARHAS
jgi:hypothetical protein